MHFFIVITCLQLIASQEVEFISRELLPSVLKDFPLPPYCHLGSSTDLIHTGPLSIWRLNLPELHQKGILLWDEEIITECWTNFIGVTSYTTLQVITRRRDSIKESELKDLFDTIKIGETKDTAQEDLYDCMWMQRKQKRTTRKWVRGITVRYYMDGTVMGYTFNKIHPSQQYEIFSNDYQDVFLRIEEKPGCKVQVDRNTTGIFRRDRHMDLLITAPAEGLQFNLNTKTMAPSCVQQTSKIYQTLNGYLVSSPLLDLIEQNNTIKKVSPKTLQVGYSNSQFLYSLNHLSQLLEHELQEIEYSICTTRRSLWNIAYHLQDVNLLGFFITGIIGTRGHLSPIGITIETPVPTPEKCKIPVKRTTNGSLLAVKCGQSLKWAEPVSGLITNAASTLSYQPPLLPLDNGIYIHYFSGKIIHAEGINLTHLDPYLQIALPEIYHQNELHFESATQLNTKSFLSQPGISLDLSFLLNWFSLSWIQGTILTIAGIFVFYKLTIQLCIKKRTSSSHFNLLPTTSV